MGARAWRRMNGGLSLVQCPSIVHGPSVAGLARRVRASEAHVLGRRGPVFQKGSEPNAPKSSVPGNGPMPVQGEGEGGGWQAPRLAYVC